ncbi:hypothetical protein ACFW04_011546 [Cataglyphis niger]
MSKKLCYMCTYILFEVDILFEYIGRERPNSLWHMDAHLKLWSFVIHGCIDGYSRLIIYLICETTIQAKPVVNFFANAVNSYDLPSRVPTEHVYENLLAAILMSTIRGMHIGSHVTGKSVYNQRIERLWVDVFKEVCDSIYTELYALEDQGLLDIENITHRFCVQYIFKILLIKSYYYFNLHGIFIKMEKERERERGEGEGEEERERERERERGREE